MKWPLGSLLQGKESPEGKVHGVIMCTSKCAESQQHNSGPGGKVGSINKMLARLCLILIKELWRPGRKV